MLELVLVQKNHDFFLEFLMPIFEWIVWPSLAIQFIFSKLIWMRSSYLVILNQLALAHFCCDICCSWRRRTALHPALKLLNCSAYDVLVFLKDGRQTLEQMVGVRVQLHVGRRQADRVHQEAQLSVRVWESLLEQGDLCGLHLIDVGLHGIKGMRNGLFCWAEEAKNA